MGIKDLIEIGKLMWNLVRNAKEFAALQEENSRLKADLAALKARHEGELATLKAGHAQEIATLRTENADLHAKLDPWVGYEAYSPVPGATVYRFVPSEGSTAAEHLACPKCRDIYGKKSILQFGAILGTARCPACETGYGFRFK